MHKQTGTDGKLHKSRCLYKFIYPYHINLVTAPYVNIMGYLYHVMES